MSSPSFIFMAVIAMYSTTVSSQCSSPVTSFPVSDDFEISIGNWNQDPTDNFDWTRNSGTTGSSGTGPTTGNGGSSWYMYTESSSPNASGQIANLLSPCIAVAGLTTFEFSYHMYSTTTMGTFNVDVRINGAGGWTNIWTRTGNQGNTWLDESLNLDTYNGQNIEIRFSVITNTFRSDVAIDDVTITQLLEICDNGIDDDLDGLIDISDPDCSDCPINTVSERVSSGSDDAEENLATGSVDLTSTDLELADDGTTTQLVGMRFNGLSIPAGATIVNAYVEFETDVAWSSATNLTIQGQNSDNPITFANSSANLSNATTRPKTSASIPWTPGAWNTIDEKHQSPDIKLIIQEIVNRSGWASGNSMAIFIQGAGTRESESFDGEAGAAPLLVIEYLDCGPEICGNGIDDDGDGLTDCDDPDCEGEDPINLALCQQPDIASFFISTSYNATTDQFIASGYASSLYGVGADDSENISNGNYNLTATIDENGILSAGTVTITGDVGSYSGTLITGSIDSFSFYCGAPIFEFVFSAGGGAMIEDYGGLGNPVGVILSLTSTFYGDWTNDYDGGNTAVCDVAPVNCPIGGQVRNDIDEDGDLNDADAGISNVTITLYNDTNCDGNGNNIKATQQTDANGFYYFPNISDGCYVIIETDSSEYYSTNDKDLVNDNKIDTVQPYLSAKPSLDNDFLDARIIETHWFEAECGIVGANWDIVSDVSASNDKYATIKSGNTSNTTAPTGSDDRIRFNVTITNPGDFNMYGRVRGATSDDDSFWVRVDEGTWYKWNSITQFAPTTFEWGQVYDSDNGNAPLTFTLAAGAHTVDFAYREDGAHLDKIVINNTGLTPIGEGDAASNCVEICDNNIDDDGDGNIDCLDGDCGGNSSCVTCNLLSNTEFNYGTATWTLENTSTATSSFSTDDSGQLSGYYSAFVDITNSTGTNWHTQLNSGPYTIDVSKTYNISFEAKAASAKVITAVIQQGVSPSTIYYNSPNFNITTTAQTYSVSNFSVSASSSEAVFKFYLGSDANDIWIDNVVFEEVNCTPPTLDNEVCYFISDGDGGSGSDTPDTLYTFNYETSVVVPIGPTGTLQIESMAMDTVNNIVYAADGDKFGTVNFSTGQFSQISSKISSSLNGADGILDIDDIDGMTFDHANNIIWATERRTVSGDLDGSPDDLLIIIDPNTGLADQNGFGAGIGYLVINTPENDLDDIAIADDGTLYAISNFGGSGNQSFGIINKTTGAWTEIGDYGIEDVESLAFTATGQLVATTGKDGHDENQLFTIDAGTGIATYVGSILPGHDVEACDCMSGLFRNLQIGDKVFADLDSDGIQDLEEPGVANVTVNLLTNSGSPFLNGIGAPMTTVTDAFGVYNFKGLGGGQYMVEFILPGGGESFTTANAGGNDELDSDANTSTGRTPVITLSGSTNNLSLDAGILNANVVVRDCNNHGELFVIDGGGTIKRFDQYTGAFIGDFIQGLNGPIEMLVGSDDWLYVSNRIEDEVRKYSLKTGVLIETITGDLRDPHGMTVGPDGNIYVNNDDYDEVIKIDVATGVTSKFTISAAGGLDGNKWGIEFGPDGNLYVASFYSDEVLRYNGTTGAFMDVFVVANSSNINAPSDITFGPDGHLYVAGKYNDKVCKYNGTTGAFMSTFVGYQSGGLQDPVHLQFGEDGFLYVSSQSNSIGVLKYNGTTGGVVGNFAYTAAPEGILFAPVPGCSNCDISLSSSVTNCIDQPLRDVAELTVTVDWTTAPIGGNLIVETGYQSRTIDGNLSSPQSVDFVVTADGTANRNVKVYWDNQQSCESNIMYNSPSSCSTEELTCDILYLCGLDKPYDGDAWDHGWIEYIDDINGSAILTPILTKDEAGMGTYDPMSQSTFVNVNLSDYDIIIISATTENHISSDLVNQLKNSSASILLSNFKLLDDLGMSSTAGTYTWDDEAFTDASTAELIYNFNNPTATSGNLFTHGDYGNEANASLWASTGANNDGVLFTNSSEDALPGIASTHGDRVYVGYHFSGVYANTENNGSLPSPVSSWFVPETHLTLIGKELFDRALLYAGNHCVDEICDDGKDNDGDGLTDCEDPECSENIAGVTNDQSICHGESAIITATGGGSYLWDNGLGTGATHAVSPIVTTKYMVTVTSPDGCTEVDSTTLTVSPDLSVSIDFNGSECLENDSQLTALAVGGTAPLSYSWTGPNTFTSTNASINITNSGNYYITVTDALGCEAETSGFVYAAFEPFIFSLETSVCEGESVDLTINGSNVTGYAWDANAGNANTASVTVIPSAPSSTYVVTVTNNNGCTSTASATISAEPLPTANAGTDVTTCENEAVTISTTDAGGGTTYDWNFGANASPATASGVGPHNISYTNPNANGADQNNTVTLNVTRGDCSNSDIKNVLIRAQPDPTISFSSPSCGVDDGSITFGFVDNPNRTNIKFSIDGGANYAHATNDNVGSYTISNLPSGDYPIFTIWGNNDCPVDLGTITLTDNTIPTISNSGDATICKGSTTVLTASAAGTWTSDDESIATVSSAGIVLGISEGMVNISFVADNNCAAPSALQITVTNKEGVILSGDDILCEGNTTTITASKNGGTWSSSDNSVATINASGVVTAVSAGLVTISYNHSSNACKENSSFAIEVFATPTVSISGSAEVCAGETTTISTNGSGGFWTSSDNNIAVVSSAGLVSGISAGDVTFYYTTGDNCPSANTGTITVTPEVSVAIDFNGSECLTEDSQLSAIVTGGTTGFGFAWTGPGGFTGNTQTIDISIDGNYYVTVTDSKGCTDNTTAFVYESYEPFIFALNTTVCEGESVTLSISGASATAYQWSASAGNATTQSVTVIPSVPSTSYTVTVTNSAGCTTEATADIMVDPKPIVNITGGTDICVGENSQLSPTTGGQWTSGNSSVASVNNSGLVTGIGNGSTTFTFKSNATGCVSDPTGFINVGANGTVSISGDNQICMTDNPTMTASVSGGTWSSSNTAAATIDQDGVVTPQGQGTTTIIYDVPDGDCFNDGNYGVTIHNDPTLSLNGPSTICEGDNTYVSASTNGAWSSSDGSVATISSTGVVTGVSGGSATISFVSNVGCSAVLSTPITIIENPEVTRIGPAEICINETTTLSPTTGGIWISSNNNVATVSSNGTVTAIDGGTANFSFIESSNGCLSDETITITVYSAPLINGLGSSELCIGETTSITPSTGGTWSSNNNAVATIENNGVITAIAAGATRFIFTSNATGCSSEQSAPLSVNGKPSISFTGPTSICKGEQSSITPASGGQWSSTDVTVATISQNGTVTGVNPGTVAFIYTSNLTGCSSDPSTQLTVEEPTEITLTGPSTICVDETTSLLPNSGGTWSSSNVNIATISNDGIVIGRNAGTATFVFDSNTGCTSDPSIDVTVISNPTVSFTGPSDICIGTTTNLSPTSGGTWTSSDTIVATVEDNGLVTANAQGFAQFTFVNTNTGCESTTDGSLSVYTKPVPQIIGNDEICVGFSTYLTPSSGGTWTSSNTNIAVISSNGQVTGISQGTATFTFYETGSNCVSEASAPVTILEKSTASIEGDNSICVGETTTVLPNTGGSWISNNPGVATVTDAGVVTGVSQGLAKFTFISDGGCESNETSPVIVYDSPSISISGPSQICVDEQTQMLPSSGGTWISNHPLIASIEDNGIVTAIAPGVANFTFTDGDTGCTSDPSDDITVSPVPVTGLNGPANICVGSITFLTPSTGGIWTALDPNIATIQNNGQVTGVAMGNARFVFTKLSTGCESEENNDITVNSGPVINFTGPTSICEGDTTNITSTNPGTWESTNSLVATITNDGVITGVSAGSVKFKFTETNSGCVSQASETLIVNGPPTVSVVGSPIVCIGSTKSLSPSTGGTWESLTPSIATVTANGTVTGIAEGTAYFMFTDGTTGCKSDGSLSIDVASDVGAQITGDSEICAGYTTTLSPTNGGVWTSSNTAVATVSNFGIVTGKAPGVVTFTFVDSGSGCSTGGTTDPITVGKCLNHDFNVALVNQDIAGDISTNDNFAGVVTYSNNKVTVQKPLASLPQLIIYDDGTYSFVTNKPGKYLYKISVCQPPMNSGCPSAFLEINVIDNVYGQSNPVSNLEFATTFANADGALPGNTITVNPLSNDDCVYTVGCNLDPSTLSIIDTPGSGSVVLSGTGSFDYTPNAGFIGNDTIIYEVCESVGVCSQSRQIITVNAPNALNSIVAADDFMYTLKGMTESGNVSDNDLDPEEDDISVTQQGSIMNPILITEGSYYINADGSYEFMPNESFSGPIEIIYTVCDNNATIACADATLHIQVFDDLALKLRVYLEGSLMQNGGETSFDGHPLMRDGLRVSAFTGENHIPVKDPYTYPNELFDNTPSNFVKMGPGLMTENLEISDSLGVFSVTGDNAIVDWIHVELRNKNDNTVTVATRSGLLQRDGDIVDLDGVSLLRFQGINIDSFYVCVRHRTHLGVMSSKVSNGTFVDFTLPTTETFNFGTSLANGMDYTGLSQKSTVKSGYLTLWAGDFNSDGLLKFTEPASDINILYGNVLFSSPQYLINYDFALDYFRGDYNMDGKAKYANPNDDRNYLQGQIIFHPLNTSFISNLDGVIQQIPTE